MNSIGRCKRIARAILMLWLALSLTGCNMFDGLDTAISDRSDEDLLDEAYLALGSGDYNSAVETFQKLVDRGNVSGSVVQGLAEAEAGLAGFSVLSVLDIMQNGPGPYDDAALWFKCAKSIADIDKLESASHLMQSVPAPSRPDRLPRGLIPPLIVTKRLLQKYDTNKNGKLDVYDRIDFTTNDEKCKTWPELYEAFISGPLSSGVSLEQAFIDLFYGFDGKGESWSFLTPVAEKRLSGTFTESNRATVEAVGNLADKLEAINIFYNVNLASFSASLIDVDGAD